MKKSNKPIYDVKVKQFHSYEIKFYGKWTPVYILKVGERKLENSGIHDISILLKYIDLKSGMESTSFLNCDKNNQAMFKSQNIRAIETEPELRFHELTQLQMIKDW